MAPHRRTSTRLIAVGFGVVLLGVAVAAKQLGPDTPPKALPDLATEAPLPTRSLSNGDVTEVRAAAAPVLAGLAVRNVIFATADTGYALFERTDTAAVAVTFDGGLTWVDRPAPVAEPGLTLVVLDTDTIALRSKAGQWYLSTDSGRTYRISATEPVPPAVGPQPAVPPPLAPPVVVRAGPNGRFWAVETRIDNVVRTVGSSDGGRTWQALPDVGGPGEEAASLVVGADGEAWLLTANERDMGHVWRWAGQWWVIAPGSSDLGLVSSAVAVGDGVLLTAIPTGGVRALRAGGGPLIIGGPNRVARLVTLPDGTVQGWNRAGNVAYLCRCKGTSATWVMVSLTAQT